METPQIIIPKYRSEAPRQQRIIDWLFKSPEGFKRYLEYEKREVVRMLKENARDESAETRKTVEGLGQMTATIPLYEYLMWEKMHPGCWKDKEFRREYYRDNPEVRASRPVRKTWLVDGFGRKAAAV